MKQEVPHWSFENIIYYRAKDLHDISCKQTLYYPQKVKLSKVIEDLTSFITKRNVLIYKVKISQFCKRLFPPEVKIITFSFVMASTSRVKGF